MAANSPFWRLDARIIPIAIGLVLLFWGSRNVIRAYDSQHWPQTNGVIRSATMSVNGGLARYHKTYYAAKIAYDYQVGGVAYSSTKVSFGDYGDDNPNHARTILNYYPEGSQVSVFYKPNDPSVAVLETGCSINTWGIFEFGVILIIVFGILLPAIPRIFYFLRQKINSGSPPPSSAP